MGALAFSLAVLKYPLPMTREVVIDQAFARGARWWIDAGRKSLGSFPYADVNLQQLIEMVLIGQPRAKRQRRR